MPIHTPSRKKGKKKNNKRRKDKRSSCNFVVSKKIKDFNVQFPRFPLILF